MTIGLDTNILCYALDPMYPENKELRKLLLDLSPQNTIALNPTVIHESYHVLVFYLKWYPEEAKKRLTLLLKHPNIQFLNQTKQTTKTALNIAQKHNLEGRDSLILANNLINKIPTLYTHDQELLKLKTITHKQNTTIIKDPLNKPAI